MALEDLTPWFENLRNPSEDVDADTIINNITQVYQDDLAIRDTAVQETNKQLAERDEKIKDLQVKNYELLMKQPASNVGGDNGNNQDTGDDDRASTVTFNDLFNK